MTPSFVTFTSFKFVMLPLSTGVSFTENLLPSSGTVTLISYVTTRFLKSVSTTDLRVSLYEFSIETSS